MYRLLARSPGTFQAVQPFFGQYLKRESGAFCKHLRLWILSDHITRRPVPPPPMQAYLEHLLLGSLPLLCPSAQPGNRHCLPHAKSPFSGRRGRGFSLQFHGRRTALRTASLLQPKQRGKKVSLGQSASLHSDKSNLAEPPSETACRFVCWQIYLF